MTKLPPPLRFLALVVGGWTCVRIALLAPGWAGAEAPVAPQLRETAIEGQLLVEATPVPALGSAIAATVTTTPAAAPDGIRPLETEMPMQALSPTPTPMAFAPLRPIAAAQAGAMLLPPRTGAARWSGSAWAFVRDGGGSALAPGGTLGGSQLGGRLLYRLVGHDRRLSASGRVYTPLDDIEGAEAALGIDWKPFAALPVHLLAERRQRLGP
ncbi:MAG: hypothetical protein M3Q15_05165, partial [Pseudomonadota bacterium]|nr:hypothetical protein [Pseudomonadota bacterium]